MVFWVHIRCRKALVGIIQCGQLSKSVMDSFWDCSFAGSGVEALTVEAVELLVGKASWPPSCSSSFFEDFHLLTLCL